MLWLSHRKNFSKLEFQNWNFRKGVTLWRSKLNFFFKKFDICVLNTLTLLKVTFHRGMSLLEKYRRLNLPTKKFWFFKAKIRKSEGNSSTLVSILVISSSTHLRMAWNFVARCLNYRATTLVESKTNYSLVISSKKIARS